MPTRPIPRDSYTDHRRPATTPHPKHSNPFWRYKLNENATTNDMIIDGVHLTKEWLNYPTEQKLTRHIRTKINPNGIVDFEHFVPASGKILESSYEVFSREIKTYTSSELLMLTRPQLMELAKDYSIDPVNKRNEFLVKLIYEAQNKLQGIEGEVLNVAQLVQEKTVNEVNARKAARDAHKLATTPVPPPIKPSTRLKPLPADTVEKEEEKQEEKNKPTKEDEQVPQTDELTEPFFDKVKQIEDEQKAHEERLVDDVQQLRAPPRNDTVANSSLPRISADDPDFKHGY